MYVQQKKTKPRVVEVVAMQASHVGSSASGGFRDPLRTQKVRRVGWAHDDGKDAMIRLLNSGPKNSKKINCYPAVPMHPQ